MSQINRITATPSFTLTPDQVGAYHREGYLIVENAFSTNEVEALHRSTVDICRGKYGEFPGWIPSRDDEPDEEVIKRYLCIHFPHKVCPTILASLSHPVIKEVLTAVIGPNVKCMQSMLFIKAAGKPGQAWHQDEDYIPTRDRSLTGAWIAMDDATVDNGCLWAIPGSHRPGILWPQKYHFDKRFDCTEESYQFPYSDKDEVPLEMPAGSVVFFNGYLLHRSLPNRQSSGFRRSLVNHYMSAESLLPWHRPAEDVGMAKHDFRDIVMVAGTDPYAYKGTEDISRVYVRPSGEGGCERWTKTSKETVTQ